MPHLRKVWLLAPVALVACGFGSTVREQVHQTIPDAGTAAVHLSNAAGSVHITAWGKPSVDIHATKSADSMQALHEMNVSVRRGSDGIHIETTYTGSIRQGGVTYELSVPAGAALDVRNGAGSVTIDGARANVSVAAQAGSITANLGTLAGNRSIVLSATTGGVNLAIARNSSAKVHAVSSVDGIRSDFAAVSPSRKNVVGASASGTIGSGSARVRLTTTTGGITLSAL